MAPKIPDFTNQARLKGTHEALFYGGESTPRGESLFYIADATPRRVWETPILREGKNISALQELADCKTLLIRNEATVAGLLAAVKQLAAGQGSDPAAIQAAVEAGVKNAMSGLSATVTIGEDK